MLRVNDLTLRIGERLILDGASFSIPDRARVGLVGRNGAGKTTLFKAILGELPTEGGTVSMPKGMRIGAVAQEAPAGPETLHAVVLAADTERRRLMAEAEHADGLRRAEIETRLVDIEAHSAPARAAAILHGLGFDAEAQGRPCSDFSGGWRMRVALAAVLFSEPDLLLLDEPTNHLDAESVDWLEAHLEKYAGTVVAVTHDRYFLDNVAQWILELDRGRAYPYEGNYSTYLETKAARLKVEGAKDAKRAKRLKDELEWVRSGAKARQAKSKARLARYEEMAAEADKFRKLDFEEIQIPPGPRLGSVVIETNKLVKGFGDRVLIDGLSFSLPRNGIVGIVGPNGVGKTTLFKMLVDQETPDGGEIKVGETVKISYVEQNRSGIDPAKSLWEVVSDGLDHIKVGNVEVPSRAYVSAFGFKGHDQQKKAGVLSGGERNRLNLALTLKQGGNLLLLDEPTNDLDTETLTSLESALLEFPGCAVVVSHDRWFLDRVATHILAYEGDSQWFWFEGNFDDYEKNKIERLGADAARPHRATYRKLSRD